jgi:hypothetical protein
MNFYRLASIEIDFRFVPKPVEKLCMPKRYCSACKRTTSAVGASLPERIPDPVRIRLKPYQLGAQNQLPHDLFVRQVEAWDNHDWENPVHEEVERFGAISPSEYKIVEQFIRDTYQLAPGRLIRPQTELGPKKIRKSFSPSWNILGGGAQNLYMTQPVGSVLLEAGITGLELFPVYTTDGKPSEICEATISGDGGLPNVSTGGEWYQCPECEVWYLQADHPVKLLIDEKQWDGSDFFHFARQGFIYVSETAVRILENRLLLVGSWVNFVPMQDDWIRPVLNAQGEQFT